MRAQKDLSKSIIRRQFTSSAVVMTMVELSHSLTAIIDGLMTSRILGATEMAAYGLVAPYFTVATIISGMLMVSCQTMCTRCMATAGWTRRTASSH